LRITAVFLCFPWIAAHVYAASDRELIILGKKLEVRCGLCHGEDGSGGERGPDIAQSEFSSRPIQKGIRSASLDGVPNKLVGDQQKWELHVRHGQAGTIVYGDRPIARRVSRCCSILYVDIQIPMSRVLETRFHPIMARTSRHGDVFGLARCDLVEFFVFIEILDDECRKTHSGRHKLLVGGA
jgi:hypothetical protein